jgi:hypothetical protein
MTTKYEMVLRIQPSRNAIEAAPMAEVYGEANDGDATDTSYEMIPRRWPTLDIYTTYRVDQIARPIP